MMHDDPVQEAEGRVDEEPFVPRRVRAADAGVRAGAGAHQGAHEGGKKLAAVRIGYSIPIRSKNRRRACTDARGGSSRLLDIYDVVVKTTTNRHLAGR